MTLSAGNHVVKLDTDGTPIMDGREVYVEYEIVHVAYTAGSWDEVTKTMLDGVALAVLRKVR